MNRKVLVLIPCCQNKDGQVEYFPTERTIFDYAGVWAARLIRSGMQECRSLGDFDDQPNDPNPVSALSRYNGYLYTCSPDFRNIISRRLDDSFHLLILSACYGLLRPEERIIHYNKTMNEREKVWKAHNLPLVIEDYISKQGITHLYGIFARSTAYMRMAKRVRWMLLKNISSLRKVFLGYPTKYQGSPYELVPRLCGFALMNIMQHEFEDETMANGFQFSEGRVQFIGVV